jgi:hypothetical protein
MENLSINVKVQVIFIKSFTLPEHWPDILSLVIAVCNLCVLRVLPNVKVWIQLYLGNLQIPKT